MAQDEFFQLVEPHVVAMLRIAAAMIGVTNAEDIVQESVIKAWQAVSSLRDPHLIRPWLLRIIVNCCRDWQRGREYKLAALSLPLEEAVEKSSDAEREIGSDLHADALDLRQAVRLLAPELRLLVLLHYYAGENSADIGLILGISASTVRTRLARAIAHLRESLEQLDPLGETR